MQTIPVSLTGKKLNPTEGEHNTSVIKFTLSEELRGYSIYIVRRTDGYGETTDSERLKELNGELTMALTNDILRGKSLKMQIIAMSQDFELVAKSEIVEIPVDPSLYLTNGGAKQKDLLVEMVGALERADKVVSGAQNAVTNAEQAVANANEAVEIASVAAETAAAASAKALEAAKNVKDGTTYTPSVDSVGNLSWTNPDGKVNPPSVNIKGERGVPGERGEQGRAGATGQPGKSAYQSAQEAGFTGAEDEFYTLLALVSVLKFNKTSDGGKVLGVSPYTKKLCFDNPVNLFGAPELNWITDFVNGKLSALNERIEKGNTDALVEMLPGKLYVFPEMTALNYSLNGTGEFHFIFKSGAVPTELTHPTNVNVGGFTVEANKIYEVSILENLLMFQSWEAAV